MKTAYDLKHVKGTTAICLLNKATGHYCGRIVANWSDNPNGTVCTATINLFGNMPKGFAGYQSATGTADGYGYDKLSSAIYSALKQMGLHNAIKVESASGNQRNAFENAGFIYIEVC